MCASFAWPVLRGNVDFFQLCQKCQRCWQPIGLDVGGQIFTQKISRRSGGMRIIMRKSTTIVLEDYSCSSPFTMMIMKNCLKVDLKMH